MAVVVVRRIDRAKAPPYDRVTETRKAGHRAKGISCMELYKGRPRIIRTGVIAILYTMPNRGADAPCRGAATVGQTTQVPLVVMESRMRLKAHVRFERRGGETYPSQGG